MSTNGWHHTETSKAKLRVWNTGRKMSAESVEKRKRFGPNNANWKGGAVGDKAAHDRCRTLYPDPLGRCERAGCIRPARDRHHRDGNPRNNNRENVRFLCRGCHQIEDGRATDRVKEMNEAIRGVKQSPETCARKSAAVRRVWKAGRVLVARGKDGRWQAKNRVSSQLI